MYSSYSWDPGQFVQIIDCRIIDIIADLLPRAEIALFLQEQNTDQLFLIFSFSCFKTLHCWGTFNIL